MNKTKHIIFVGTRGICIGVDNAIKATKNVISKYKNQDIYFIGQLVHNNFVVDYFKKQGVIFCDDTKLTRSQIIESLPANSVVIFSAHGSEGKAIELAKQKNMTIIDTTCGFVRKTQILAKRYSDNGYTVIFVGKKHHPETKSILAISSKILFVENKNDATDLIKNNPSLKEKKIFVTNQTTLGTYELKDIFVEIKSNLPCAVIANDLCIATSERQHALLDAFNVCNPDLVLIIGDIKSNNTNSLLKIIKEKKFINAFLINKPEDIDKIEKQLYLAKIILITRSASSPLSQEIKIVNYLHKKIDNKNQRWMQTLHNVEFDRSFLHIPTS